MAEDATASSSPSQRPDWGFRRPGSLVSQSYTPTTIGTRAHSARTRSWWARNRLIGVSIASGSFGSVAPYGAREGFLDTNPIAVGFPTIAEPIVWDIATSAISGSEVHRRLVTGQELPDGVALDPRGEPTRDPAEALAGANLPWGGHRGTGLAIVIRLLGLLSGVRNPAIAFARGARTGVLMIRTPSAVNTASDDAVNLASRSRIKNFSPWPRVVSGTSAGRPAPCAAVPERGAGRPAA
jgi:Malate/L-lactate dehydrogenase